MLAPGGTILFAGEPSRYGDRLARIPKRFATAVAPAWRLAMGAPAASHEDEGDSDEALERVVDVHAFGPGELAGSARAAGFEGVRVSGEELVANWFGWTNRTLEATADPERRAVGLAPVRLPRLPRPAGPRPAAAGGTAAGGDLLQPDAHRAKPDGRGADGTVIDSGAWPRRCRDFPLFPLGLVALPTESVPLHIFEDRYLRMIAHCMEGEGSEFGILWLSDEELKQTGCACRIEQVLERTPTAA